MRCLSRFPTVSFSFQGSSLPIQFWSKFSNQGLLNFLFVNSVVAINVEDRCYFEGCSLSNCTVCYMMADILISKIGCKYMLFVHCYSVSQVPSFRVRVHKQHIFTPYLRNQYVSHHIAHCAIGKRTSILNLIYRFREYS